MAPVGTKGYDAYNPINNDRYSIKTVKNSINTGTFNDDFSAKRFEFLIAVFLDKKTYEVKLVLEASWEIVNEFKHYHSAHDGYYIGLSKKFKRACRIIYSQ